MRKSLLFLSCLLFSNNIAFASEDNFFCENCTNGTLKLAQDTSQAEDSIVNGNQIEKPLRITQSETKQQDTLLQKSTRDADILKKIEQDNGPKESRFDIIMKKLSNGFARTGNLFSLDNVSGIYVFGGWSKVFDSYMSRATGNAMETSNTAPAAFNKHKNDGYYFALGARYYISHFFISPEVFYLNPNFDMGFLWNLKQNSYIHYLGVTSNPTTKIHTMSTNISIKNIYGASLRMGLGFKRFVGYGKIGLAIASIEDFTQGLTVKFSETMSKQKLGINYGAGIEFFITENVFMRLEYNEFKFTYKLAPTGYSYITQMQQLYWNDKINFRSIILGLGFKF
jgi:opacity protein-like surface antigen